MPNKKSEENEEIVETPVEETAVVEETVEAATEKAVEAAPETVEAPVEKAAKPAKKAKTVETTGDDSPAKPKGKRAEKVGIVSSDKMTNTVVVRVDRLVKHPVYRKYVKRRKKFMAHDETGAKIGDKVKIIETRPLSARKRWRVVEIIQKAEL